MSTRSARVRVPASTSNLGGGFDCIGMAVDRWLEASVTPTDGATRIARAGALATLKCETRRDLLYQGFVAACNRAGVVVPDGLSFDVTSKIPVARGLGSSAAALVAGAALAEQLLSLGLGREGVALLIAQFEGHPDNAAPATFGGATLGVARDDAEEGKPCTYAFAALPVHDDLRFVYAVPSLEITTASARAVLPHRVSFADAVGAVQRSAALVQGLATADGELLARALDDVLHVPYRRSLLPGYDSVERAAREAGAYGATLSGSGSTMVAVGRVGSEARIADAMRTAFAGHGEQAEIIVSAGAVGGLEWIS